MNILSDLTVGKYGSGTLNVEAGGVVPNSMGYHGRSSGSTGVATVAGSDSQWNNSNYMHVGGGLSNAGVSGTLNLNDSGLVAVSNTINLWVGGTVNLKGGILSTSTLDLTECTFNILDGLLHVDSVAGNINVKGGIVAPGDSPGFLSITGNYTQGAAATLGIGLAGTANGEYDRLLVAGALDVSGALDIQLLDGFTQTGDTAFHVLDAMDLSGAFSSLVLPDLLGNLSWDSSRLYTSGTLSVIPKPATLSLLTLGGLMMLRRRR